MCAAALFPGIFFSEDQVAGNNLARVRRHLAIELPDSARDSRDTKAQFNFPINDAFALDLASHLLHLALFTWLVANAAEDHRLEAAVAAMFILPEAATVCFAGQLSAPHKKRMVVSKHTFQVAGQEIFILQVSPLHACLHHQTRT